jgi:hypothetical protein
VLVADRALHVSERPTMPGGGTVQFVTPTGHRYITDIEALEEAGTPAILGDIRAGLAIQLKSDVGVETIHAAEQRAIARATERWRNEPGVELLGPSTGTRLPIFSFNLRNGNRLLHHGFAVRLLNDLFGIQARGGCSCAGPYGHELLGIDAARSSRYQRVVESGNELFKPGWVRVGFHYSFDETTVDAIIDAVAFVARRGRSLLPLYEPSLADGRWLRVGGEPAVESGWDELCAQWRGNDVRTPACGVAPDFAACLDFAEGLADEAEHLSTEMPAMPKETDDLRWFWLPGER